jgi:hypothetical protein
MNLKESKYGNVDWIHLAQNSVQWQVLENSLLNLQVPQKEGNF